MDALIHNYKQFSVANPPTSLFFRAGRKLKNTQVEQLHAKLCTDSNLRSELNQGSSWHHAAPPQISKFKIRKAEPHDTFPSSFPVFTE